MASSFQSLDKLFGSKARVKVLAFLLQEYESEFYVRELTRRLKEQINSVRRELETLEGIGLVTSRQQDRKKFFSINRQHPLFRDLQSLFLRAKSTPVDVLQEEARALGRIVFVALSGCFTQSDSRVDVLVVGDVDRTRLKAFVAKLEEEQGREINYTVMPETEFVYRRDLKDQFLLSVIDGKHVTVLDETTQSVAASAGAAVRA